MPRAASDERVVQQFGQYLEPGEARLIYAYGQSGPPSLLVMFLLGPLLAGFFTRYYFIGLTRQRLLLMQTARKFTEKETTAYSLTSLTAVAVKKGWLGWTVRFTTPTGQRYAILLRRTHWGLKHQEAYAAAIRERLGQLAGAA